MSQWAQQITEQYLAEQIKQNPQNIWELFPRDKELIENVDQEMQEGELLASEAEELVRANTEQAQSEWIQQASRELVNYIVEFETGRHLEDLLEKIRMGDKEAALVLAKAVYPEPETPEHEALMKITRLYQDDIVFLSAISQALEQAREKEQLEAKRLSREGATLSTGRLIEIFFWITFNEEWLREGLGDYEADYGALVDHFGEDKDLPHPEAFRRMLHFFGF